MHRQIHTVVIEPYARDLVDPYFESMTFRTVDDVADYFDENPEHLEKLVSCTSSYLTNVHGRDTYRVENNTVYDIEPWVDELRQEREAERRHNNSLVYA